MSNAPEFSKLGFAKTFILPALMVFLVPILALLFFLYAQDRWDREIRDDVIAQIVADRDLTPEERDEGIAFYKTHPFSELARDPAVRKQLPSTTAYGYQTFYWMIRLSAAAILSGPLVCLLLGLGIIASLRSQSMQYVSLSLSWQALRLYGALQAIAQGAMLVALSFWVTAIWFEWISIKLIFIVGALAVVAVGAVIMAIFKRVSLDLDIDGAVITPEASDGLWLDLRAICDKVGTKPPDQIIAGIDDNFYVTEAAVKIAGKRLRGRTLFVSLSLLREIHGSEAAAILAHEMAHFSGEDTVYTRRIAPLLARYGAYLEALYSNAVTRPVFHFMHLFRALFQLSLGKISREREFRADRIACEATSARDVAGGLLRTVAYSKFRGEVQKGLFDHERALENANISELIRRDFQNYAVKFTSTQDLAELKSSHPFDSHPPLDQRLAAVGVPLESSMAATLLTAPGDGRWFQRIDGADELERTQWRQFEQHFRDIHERSLPYRLLPETDAEREIVVKAFPPLSLFSTFGTLAVDCQSLHFDQWPDAVGYDEITKFEMNDDGKLTVFFNRGGKQKRSFPTKHFVDGRETAVDAINHYYARYMSAAAYRQQKQALHR
jgi:Zn-dependent protease with chaperone function